METTTFENGAVMLQNGVVLEEGEIDVYEELKKELKKLENNIDGLGKQELPNGTKEEIQEKGLQILKSNYGPAYKKLVKRIGELANQYIKLYCFSLMFYKDAADVMLVDPMELVTGYITEKAPDLKKAIYTDYSLDDFTKIVDDIREKVVSLALLNWQKHRELNK